MSEFEMMPSNAFFECSPDAFDILDAQSLKTSIGRGTPEPWMSFKTAPGNVIETPPKKVVSNQNGVVGVECQDGIVYIDFYDGTAEKQSGDKKWRYMGGIDQRNDGLGYIAFS